MTQPMTDERFEQIRHDDETFSLHPNPNGVYGHRRELFAEVTRLRDELDAANSSGDRSWGREHELLHENGQLRAELAALKDVRPCGRSATHPPHKWMSGRQARQCAGVGEYDEPKPAKAKPKYRFPGDVMSAPHNEPQF